MIDKEEYRENGGTSAKPEQLLSQSAILYNLSSDLIIHNYPLIVIAGLANSSNDYVANSPISSCETRFTEHEPSARAI